MTGAAEALVREARRLDGEARRHKRAIGRHRQALQETRARQVEVERQCAALGILVTYHHETGEGDAPWPQKQATAAARHSPSSTSRP